MNRTTATAMTGVAMAAVAGTAALMMNHSKHKNPTKKLKQNAGKAIKTLGSVLDSVEYMIR